MTERERELLLVLGQAVHVLLGVHGRVELSEKMATAVFAVLKEQIAKDAAE